MTNPTFDIQYKAVCPPLSNGRKRYVTTYDVTIFARDHAKSKPVQVGKFECKLVRLEEAEEDGVDVLEVFEGDEYAACIAEEIYDFECEALNKDILKFYKEGIPSQDIIILTNLEVLPAYRGYRLGTIMLRDAFDHFVMRCGLYIMEPFPLQFRAIPSDTDLLAWYRAMHYEEMEQDRGKTMTRLCTFYKRLGFEPIRGYDKFLFANAARGLLAK